MDAENQHVDPDFSREVLEDLYTYRRKRRTVAWLLWATLGWLGAHRFYLGRDFTGALLLLTGGGLFVWWLVDAALVNGMVTGYNRKQAARERGGAPPLGLEHMPPLRSAVLERGSGWIERWRARGNLRRRLRLAGDVLVLCVAGVALGTLVGTEGALEAIAAVVLLALLATAGAGPAWLDDVPLGGTLTRWAHRLRLFYHHNEPGSPPGLLFRPVLGVVWAPFRSRARTEVRLYMELGAVFTGFFLLLDLGREILLPALGGGGVPGPASLAAEWTTEAAMTFFLTYAFTAPVGAVLTLYLLLRPTHALPRLLGLLTLGSIGAGILM